MSKPEPDSPTPWIDRDSEDCTHPVIGCDLWPGTARLMSAADYAHAAHCVNSHAALVAACLAALPPLEKALAIRRKLLGDVPGGIAVTVELLKAAIAGADPGQETPS